MSNHFRIKTLAAAIGMAAAATLCAAPAGSVATNNVSLHIVRQATKLHTGDKVLGLLDQSKPMNVAVSLKLRNKAQLDAFVANPHHPNLTPAQFRAEYAPTQAQAQAVASFLKQQGFSNVQIAPNRQLVTASGHAATAAHAFHTSFVHVHTHDGRDAFATSSAVKIPASLQSTVLEVIGLQNVHTFHVLKPVHVEASGSATGHAMTDFAKIYNAGSTATASTINVGVITEGSMSNVQSDFSSFLSQNPSLGNIPLNVVKVDGGSSDTSGDGEWDMDTQSIAGISGGVKGLYLYATSSMNTQPLVDAFNKAVTDDVVRVINVSIGGCETGSETNGAATGDNIFEQAASQGQTFSISSGDSGADECGDGGVTPSWPSDSQYVISAGGTELYTSGTTWTNETVWNNLSSNEGATGGSPSTFEAQPSWQKNVGQNAGSNYRGLPDIAFDASPESGSLVIVDGQQEQIGGTSLASPLFVGVWARTLAADPSLGFAAPLIYADAKTNYASDFHDVTSGNNSGETAATGWDYCTGFGSINIANFISHVAGGGSTPPPPSGSTPTANFTYTANGLSVSFTDASSDTGSTISSYSWNFGDGGSSTSASPSHTYAASGTYNVVETVTDGNGNTDSKSESVTVSSGSTPPPTGGVFSNNTAKTIADNATITSSIKVTGEPGAAPSTLKVHVSITHNWSGDLEIVLYAPNGASAVLQQPDYNDDGNINATWTVNASSVQGNGTWKLKVIDNDPWYYGDYGKLNNWSLTF
ncbi:protease pro-enzyme activation domain-containing protein [Rhodanobacter sp. 115]|jgi:pseudomonalisin/xanthomonalisin|uniref:protease pro-enzyme activation domain-containing protein n=1 Tax=Rhodanobacter sp. FW021-MT20 TaxID=1162282 RepID=UPI000260D6B2|nr:protease pro-enzyme activation domain-containing protein [Rhodanobacter sp. 115]EIL98048.1 protease [Rhodanobacter sp. 115]